MRSWSTIFAAGLIISWIAGIGNPDTADWLGWALAVAGALGFVVASAVGPYASRGVRAGAPLGLALLLFALWGIGVFSADATWQSWWAFSFGCGYALLGISALVVRSASDSAEFSEAMGLAGRDMAHGLYGAEGQKDGKPAGSPRKSA